MVAEMGKSTAQKLHPLWHWMTLRDLSSSTALGTLTAKRLIQITPVVYSLSYVPVGSPLRKAWNFSPAPIWRTGRSLASQQEDAQYI